MGDLNRWDYATYSGHVEWYEDQQQGAFVFYDEVKELQVELDELRNRPTCEEVEALRNEVERLEGKLEDETKRRNLWIENSKELVIERNEALAKAEGENT